MLQTLVVIASIVVLSAAILTSSLVSAKNAFHQTVVAKTQTAMTDATSEFTFWAQKFVAKYGTEANWNAVAPPVLFHPMCDAGVGCAYNATITWTVTGATVGVKPANIAGQSVSVVHNMAQAVDEQRISATISVGISNATGKSVYGGRTEEVTARVFDSQPYVVVTGVRDLSSDAGLASDSEGDSGGTVQIHYGNTLVAPNSSLPSYYNDTVIRTTIDCANTVGFDEGRPQAPQDSGTALVDYSFRQGGAQGWAYQLPCTPQYGVPNPPPGITNYSPPVGTVYEIGSSTGSASWNKGDASGNSFAR